MEKLTLCGKVNKDCKVFTTNVENEALSLIYNILDSPAFPDVKIRIMPDVHAGKGITIGFSAPLTNMVCPSHVGVDIGCMIDTYVLDKELLSKDFATIELRIRQRIPFGFNVNGSPVINEKDFFAFLNRGYARARSTWPEMVNPVDKIDGRFIEKMLTRVGMDAGVFYKSLGSVGGGNHFIEVGRLQSNNLGAITIHCGSRNFGVKVCNYWENIASSSQIDNKLFREECRKLKAAATTKDERLALPAKIDVLKKEFLSKSAPNGYLTGDNMRGYISDMVIAQLYAEYNHKVIAERVLPIFAKLYKAKATDHLVSVHNYIDMNDHIIRKGAIRSYRGESVVIPFNMRDGVGIGYGKSNPEWNCTAPHGAGRIMSRSKAKATLSMDEYKKQMEDANIYSTSVCKSTIDEAPNAYKPMQEILDAIKPTCEITDFIIPVISMKSTDENA